jgi:tRNA-splicing ligase RtcB
MKTKDLIHLGVPEGEAMQCAHAFLGEYIAAGNDGAALADDIFRIVADPSAYFDDALRAPLARALYRPAFMPRAEPAPWRQWGDDLDPASIKQMANACALPVAVAGALMPDAHVGYGLPTGGVLATENAVVPYAVGVDIACRMKLTVYDRKANILVSKERGVELLSSGLDEVPGVYKDIYRYGRANRPR